MFTCIVQTVFLAPFRPRRVAELHSQTPLIHAVGYASIVTCLTLLTVFTMSAISLSRWDLNGGGHDSAGVADASLLGLAAGVFGGGGIIAALLLVSTVLGLLPWVGALNQSSIPACTPSGWRWSCHRLG